MQGVTGCVGTYGACASGPSRYISAPDTLSPPLILPVCCLPACLQVAHLTNLREIDFAGAKWSLESMNGCPSSTSISPDWTSRSPPSLPACHRSLR